MNYVKHFTIVVLCILVILGIPFLCTDYGRNLLSGEGADAVTSASVILDAPSGKYIVLINEKYREAGKVEEWETFFSGGDITYIFEDIKCGVANSDPGAIEMAESFRSRLPENQMKVQRESSTVLLSRGDVGAFDIIIISEEFAKAVGADSMYTDDVKVVKVEGSADEED